MKAQFSDDEFTASAHVNNNDTQSQRFWQALQGLPSLAQANSERPDHFWTTQRAQIWRSIEGGTGRRAHRTLALAWTAAAAVVAITAILLSAVPPPKKPQAHVDPDHELLLDIERSLNMGGPQALEPATLLVEEISQNTQSNPASPVEIKERMQ
jgi:hypothetical protein